MSYFWIPNWKMFKSIIKQNNKKNKIKSGHFQESRIKRHLGILRISIRSDNLNEDCIYKISIFTQFYIYRSEIKLPSSFQAQLLQSKLRSNQHQGRGKMTALQLGKRVIDHNGPCHYCDRASLSNSAHFLFKQSS